MKFGNQFEFHKVPEWSDYYLDYRVLKKLLKEILVTQEEKLKHTERLLSIETVNNETKALEMKEFDPVLYKELFIQNFTKSLSEVDSFLLKQLKSLEKQLENFINGIDTKKRSTTLFKTSVDLESFQKSFTKTLIKENAERDEVGYAASWKRAISEMYNYTSWLHSFCVINRIATLKIIKKFCKVMKQVDVDATDAKLESLVERSPFVQKVDSVIDLRKRITNFYALEFLSGDRKRAQGQLQSRMSRKKNKDIGLIYFFFGVLSILAVTFMLTHFIPNNSVRHNTSITIFFPAFNFALNLALLIIGLGIDVKVFQKYKINYIFIFEIDPNKRLGPIQFFRIGLFLIIVSSVLLLLMQYSLCFEMFNGKFFIFPSLLLIFLLSFFLWPFHCFYFSFRKGLLRNLAKIFFPFGKHGVRYRDFVLTNMISTLSRPLSSLTLSVCLISCVRCREDNVRDDCNRKSILALILQITPYLLRFLQCQNRLYYTKLYMRNGTNSLKFACAATNVFLSWYVFYNPDVAGAQFQFKLFITTFMILWDIFMGWGLGRIFSRNFFLRDKIVYPKWMYYSAIVSNTLIRVSWLVDFQISKEADYFIRSLIEIFRRCTWLLFRVENENTNNPDKYRTILAIPDLPLD